MKRLFPLVCLLSMLLSGCFIKNLHNKLFNPPDCSKPSPFSSVIIAPFSTDEVLIEGISEGKEMVSIGGGLKGITNRIGETLKDKLAEYKKFDKITQGGECGDRAIKVEGKVIGLAHIHRTGYVVVVRGAIINCTTGETLYKFEVKEDDDELYKVPDKIAKEIAEDIYDKLLCQPSTHNR